MGFKDECLCSDKGEGSVGEFLRKGSYFTVKLCAGLSMGEDT